MKQDKTEDRNFDFKKAQRELIRKELRPILYEYGFVLCRPTAYIRERRGLLRILFQGGGQQAAPLGKLSLCI